MACEITNVYVLDQHSLLYCFSAVDHYTTSKIEMQALLSTLKRFGEYVIKDDIKHIQFASKIFMYIDHEDLTFICEAQLFHDNHDYKMVMDALVFFLRAYSCEFYDKNYHVVKRWRISHRIDNFDFHEEYERLKDLFNKRLEREYRQKPAEQWTDKIADRLETALF